MKCKTSFPCIKDAKHDSPCEPEHHLSSISMILFCPSCHKRHIDIGEFATRLHHTHACQECGVVWRPAIVNTIGVQFLPGFKDDQT